VTQRRPLQRGRDNAVSHCTRLSGRQRRFDHCLHSDLERTGEQWTRGRYLRTKFRGIFMALEQPTLGKRQTRTSRAGRVSAGGPRRPHRAHVSSSLAASARIIACASSSGTRSARGVPSSSLCTSRQPPQPRHVGKHHPARHPRTCTPARRSEGDGVRLQARRRLSRSAGLNRPGASVACKIHP
jgi:hypothetical protein